MPTSPNPWPVGSRIRRLEPHAVVLEDQQDAIRSPFEDHLDAPGARMFGDVVERFLRDSVQRCFHFRRKSIVEQPRRVQLGRDTGALRPFLNVVGQRGPQAEVVECGWPQLPDELIDVPIETLGDRLERLQVTGEIGAAARTPP